MSKASPRHHLSLNCNALPLILRLQFEERQPQGRLHRTGRQCVPDLIPALERLSIPASRRYRLSPTGDDSLERASKGEIRGEVVMIFGTQDGHVVSRRGGCTELAVSAFRILFLPSSGCQSRRHDDTGQSSSVLPSRRSVRSQGSAGQTVRLTLTCIVVTPGWGGVSCRSSEIATDESYRIKAWFACSSRNDNRRGGPRHHLSLNCNALPLIPASNSCTHAGPLRRRHLESVTLEFFHIEHS
jgi:hypothetical protein